MKPYMKSNYIPPKKEEEIKKEVSFEVEVTAVPPPEEEVLEEEILEEEKEEFICTICGKTFSSKRGLKNHMRKHEREKI